MQKPSQSKPCAQCGQEAATTADTDAPITHCEWCGVEYPAPEADPNASEGRSDRRRDAPTP